MINTEQLIQMRDALDSGDSTVIDVRQLIQHHIDANNMIAQQHAEVAKKRAEIVRLREALAQIQRYTVVWGDSE